ncbi:MAG: YmdB family metallophosphoesterase, partial [Akkermansia sp.]|nr:YmdB family metallophosphoesterase [Akkermansia sp.]
MRILFLGDVVGEPGRIALYKALPELKAERKVDVVVVNGENAAGGKGIIPRLAREFMANGVDVITLGDHVWDQSDLIPWLPEAPTVLRPFNLQPGTPGHGSCIIDTPAGKLGVLCLQGRTFMRPGAENPYTQGYDETLRLREAGAEAILVDFHGETTSEKIAMGYRMDGVASAVIGTHTHVQTGDERILPGGTAYLTDAGMCGSRDGVIGRDAESVLQGLITNLPNRFPIAGFPAMVNGVL